MNYISHILESDYLPLIAIISFWALLAVVVFIKDIHQYLK
jgi:hypothetical protein